jgi:hypothetical protein
MCSVSTPEIGNRRRETDSQGHGVNLASRTHPPGPRTFAGHPPGHGLISTTTHGRKSPCCAVVGKIVDGRNTATHQHTAQCGVHQLTRCESTTERHTASQWEAHMTSCCAGTKPPVANDLSGLRDKRGIPGRTSSWRPAGPRLSLGVCMNRKSKKSRSFAVGTRGNKRKSGRAPQGSFFR